MTTEDKYKRRYERERRARKEAEKILEERSREIYFNNKQLHAILENMENLVKVRTEELQSALTTAKQSNEAKSRFLANMSHEIRTPMNAIIGMLHLVLETELNSKQRNYISKVHQSALTLLGIIDDILDFSKIEANKLEIEKKEYCLTDVFDNITNLIGLKSRQKNLDFIFDIDPSLPMRVIGDSLRLSQILINLTNNSLKFTDKGYLAISVNGQQRNDSTITLNFTVEDSGIGISQEAQQKIFESFNQNDSSITRQFGGTGLGLSISSRLVSLMGGELTVQSELGQGSKFSFSIDNIIPQNSPSMVNKADEKLSNKNLLIIDNRQRSLDIMTKLCDFFGLTHTAINLPAEIYKLNQLDLRLFELAIIDYTSINSHKMKILAFIEKIHLLPSVLISTADFLSKKELKELKNMNLKVAGVIQKPINPNSFHQAISVALGITHKSSSENTDDEAYVNAIKKLQGAKILLAEDNELNQELAVDLIQSNGMSIEIAENGEEALKMIELNTYDGVLMDCQMPVMNGYEATRVIRKHECYAELPIIALTANVMTEDIKKISACGMNDYISKPINVKNLFLTMSKWFTASNTPENIIEIDGVDVNPLQKYSIQRMLLKYINTESAIKRLGNDEELYCKLLNSYFERQQNVVAEITQALSVNANSLALRLIHTLKGLSGSIGAEQLQKSLADLEFLIHEKAPYKGQLLVVEEEFKHVITDLQKIDWNNKNNPTQPVVKPLNKDELDKQFLLIKGQIEDFDSEAEDSLNKLISQVDGKIKRELSKICDQVKIFDFSAAEELFSELIKSLKLEHN